METQNGSKIHRVGVIMNGVTGRMGTNQHYIRSILAIRKQGGVKITDGEYIMPDPILVGRNEAKLRQLAAMGENIERVHHRSRQRARRSAEHDLFRRADHRPPRRRREKSHRRRASTFTAKNPRPFPPRAAYELYEIAKKAGVKNGVVQDKLWLPGLMKLQQLIKMGFFGKILSVRGEFGYWVFTGRTASRPQRPSWNYRKEDDGGIIVDMLCHWRYVLDNLFGNVKAVSCYGATHVEERLDEQQKPYKCTADDAAYATFELEGGVVAQFNSSWTVRVRRDDLLTLQVDGTKGSAVAGLRDCVAQHHGATPRPTWNPDIDSPINFFDNWTRVPAQQVFDNAFKVQWEMFLRHVVQDEPFRFTLLEGAKGVQLAEKGIESWEKRAWVDVPELKA